MNEETKKEEEKKETKPEGAVKEKIATVLKKGENQKVLTITTDGKNVNVDAQHLNALEIEMLLRKVLARFTG